MTKGKIEAIILRAGIVTSVLMAASVHQLQARDEYYSDRIRSKLAFCKSKPDAEVIEASSASAHDGLCCSKSAGYCVECYTGTDKCKVTSYFIRNPNKVPDSPVPASDLLAPTPDRTVPGKAGTKPKLQLDAPMGDVLAPIPDEAVPGRLGTAPKLQIQ